jgi:hypothetical protein
MDLPGDGACFKNKVDSRMLPQTLVFSGISSNLEDVTAAVAPEDCLTTFCFFPELAAFPSTPTPCFSVLILQSLQRQNRHLEPLVLRDRSLIKYNERNTRVLGVHESHHAFVHPNFLFSETYHALCAVVYSGLLVVDLEASFDSEFERYGLFRRHARER